MLPVQFLEFLSIPDSTITHSQNIIRMQIGYYRLIYQEDGKEVYRGFAQFHVVLKKINGKWKIAQDWDTRTLLGEDIREESILEMPMEKVSRDIFEYNRITKEVSFSSSEGVTLFGDLAIHPESDKILLLFHQGRSNVRAEFEYTLPKLYQMGYSILAMDIRNGGELYGSVNRTIANSAMESAYCDAESDISSSLDHLLSLDLKKKIILTGSSFSATMSIRVAADHQKDIAGVIAFSPSSGGPMKDCLPDEAIADLKKPLLVVRPEREMEIESVADQLQLVKKNGHQTFVAPNGVHGSSLLVPYRVGKDVSENWLAIHNFLDQF
jgi:dienelactone hydrolase